MPTRIAPSIRSIILLRNVKANTNVNIDENINTEKSTILIPRSTIGRNKAEIPRINNALNTFEPSTFPRASCGLPLRAAMTHVTNSGNEVPTATIVIDTTLSLNPKLLAIATAESRNKFPPYNNIARNAIADGTKSHIGLSEKKVTATVSSAVLFLSFFDDQSVYPI